MINENIKKWFDIIEPWVLTNGVKILVVIAMGLIAGKISAKLIERAVRISLVKDTLLSKLAQKKRQDTLMRIFTGVSRIAIFTVTCLMILQEVGLNIGPILAGAGIIGLAVGFGGQYLIRDVISGLFIILENQYRIGDVVSFDGTGGLVEDISLRMTTIRDLDGTVHHIPHGEIKKVANLSKHFSRVNLNIGIGYSSDLEHVIAVINATGNELAADPAWEEHIISAPQFLRVDDFAASSIIVKILGETQPIKQWDVAGELRKRLKIAFDREKIEIPFPQAVVHVYRDNSGGEGRVLDAAKEERSSRG